MLSVLPLPAMFFDFFISIEEDAVKTTVPARKNISINLTCLTDAQRPQIARGRTFALFAPPEKALLHSLHGVATRGTHLKYLSFTSAAEQHFHASAAHFLYGDNGGGQPNIVQHKPLDAVEPDDGNIFRNAHTVPFQTLYDAVCEFVVHAEYNFGQFVAAHIRLDRTGAAIEADCMAAVEVFPLIFRIFGDRVFKPFIAQPRVIVAQRPAEKGSLPKSLLHDLPHEAVFPVFKVGKNAHFVFVQEVYTRYKFVRLPYTRRLYRRHSCMLLPPRHIRRPIRRDYLLPATRYLFQNLKYPL